MEIKLSEEELDFIESFNDPVCMSEILFTNYDNMALMHKNDLAHIRLGQIPLLSFEYLLDDQEDLSEKENFQLKKGSGDLYCMGGRNFGKTMVVEKVDIVISMLLLPNERVGFSSCDHGHIKGVLEDIVPCLEHHPILKLYKKNATRSPYRFTLKNGYVLESINMNVFGQKPGAQFFQKHFHRLYIEECCVSGHTKIRYVDKDGIINSKNISYLVNSKEYKNIKVFSYNILEKKIELKKITKVFKKRVKDYTYFKITIESNTGTYKRNIGVSQKQRIWVDNSYKYPHEIKVGDNLCLIDQAELSNRQKAILVGCLLGDAGIDKRGKNSKFGFNHGQDQKKYMEYKIGCFKSLFTSYRRTKTKGKIGFICKDREKPVLSISSKETACLNEFVNFKYCKIGVVYTKINFDILYKYFDEISLAFWYMDDGSLHVHKNKNGTFCNSIYLFTCAFDLETQRGLVNFLEKKFSLTAKICGKDSYYLFFNKENTKKFLDIIRTYIPDSMAYKLNHEKRNFIDLSDDTYELGKSKIVKIEKIIKKYWTMYDFEVEDNHNFFANTMLVSNSFETNDVYEQRRDSISEKGCVFRVAGMCNFTRYSPAGKMFYDPANRVKVLNLPQYINPNWDEKEKEKAIKDFNGEQAVNYRVFIAGEVVTDGVSVFDMERVKTNFNYDKKIKNFEIGKKEFGNFSDLIVIEKPKNTDTCYVFADIGETAATEVGIIFEYSGKYRYVYNITIYNLTDKQLYEIFKWIAEEVQANFIGLDCTDGTGRAVFRRLEEVFPKDNLVYVSFVEKIPVGFDKDDKGNVKYENNLPMYKHEFISDWSVKNLRTLFYDNRFEIPTDFKLESQLSSIISTQSGKRTIYECVLKDNHTYQSFQVFSIMQWQCEFNLNKPVMKKKFSKTGF